jgi:hypothetical protein
MNSFATIYIFALVVVGYIRKPLYVSLVFGIGTTHL